MSKEDMKRNIEIDYMKIGLENDYDNLSRGMFHVKIPKIFRKNKLFAFEKEGEQ